MYKRKSISINSILLDSENARHGNKETQEEIYRWMTSGSVRIKVLRLAREIAQKGLSPIEVPAVIPTSSGEKKPWIVVEGNRRLAAIKFLNNPKLCSDESTRKQYESIKKSASHTIPSKIEFVIFNDFEQSSYWLTLRHGGENKGVGVLSWGPKEFASLAERLGKKTANSPAIALLAYALDRGLIDHDQYHAIPVTTLARVISTKGVKTILGCKISKGEISRVVDESYFDLAISDLLEVLASGEKTVTDLKREEQRVDVVSKLKNEGHWGPYNPSEETPLKKQFSNNVENKEEEDELSQDPEQKTRSGKNIKLRSGLREKIFAIKGHGITIPDSELKVQDILRELATLKHSGKNGTPISVAFLLRALIELSSENYLKTYPDAIRRLEINTSLRDKVKCSAKHMNNRGALSNDHTEVVLRHCDEEGGMMNINTLQRYLHSTAYFPNGETLNSMWSEIKEYVIACW